MLTALALWSGPAQAASGAALSDCLLRYDVPCAEREIEALGAEGSSDPGLLAALADVHFFAGRYVEAHDTLAHAVELGFQDRNEDLPHYERTMFATAGWVEEQRGRFVVRWRPGMDDLLVDQAFDALERSDRHLSPLIGGTPPGTTILELYPDARSFIAASSLTADDVYTTGTVALSKWSRLLVTSPRSRGQGYDWQDTIAHEYIHLVVAYRGNGDAPVPVWLQEAIAKYLDNRWRDGKDRFVLSVRQKGAIAEAIRKDNLVTFEEMHPSLAKLPTAERASLAYAQLATLMQYCFEIGGEDVLIRTMELTRSGVDSRAALARAVGATDFDALEQAWLTWLQAQDLDGKSLDELPTVLDGGDDVDTDPLLAANQRLADFVELGDLLREYEEHEAALVEYGKAVPDGQAPSPLLANRMAQAHTALGELAEAARLLTTSLLDYPDFPLSHKTLGAVREAQDLGSAARTSYLNALDYNPFDTELREALLRLARAAGDDEAAARHERALEIIRLGGEDVERAPIHTREGSYELPRLDEHTKDSRSRDAQRTEWVGERAPSFLALDVKGGEIEPQKLLGKVVVLDFWATWCGPCRKAMPMLSSLQDAHRKDGLQIIGLTDEPEAKVEPFLGKSPVSYTIGVRAGDVKDRYRVSSLPTAFVIGRDGRIAEVVVGAGDAAHERIEAAVQRALAE